jgi:hypothetical protein
MHSRDGSRPDLGRPVSQGALTDATHHALQLQDACKAIGDAHLGKTNLFEDVEQQGLFSVERFCHPEDGLHNVNRSVSLGPQGAQVSARTCYRATDRPIGPRLTHVRAESRSPSMALVRMLRVVSG